MSAVNRAVMDDIEEDAVGIAVCYAGDRHEGLFCERVFELKVAREEFTELRNGLKPDRARGIIGVDERGIVGGDGDAE